MDKSYSSLEAIVLRNLCRCPLVEGFMDTVSVRLASKEILITNEAKSGNIQEAISVARDAIHENCPNCLLKDFHKPIADAVPPRGKPGENVEKYDPTIVIHSIG